MKSTKRAPRIADRPAILTARRNLKMARSAHAYVRGNTAKFYEWLDADDHGIPHGPAVWICGDCHVGNLGPIADSGGNIEIQIRDLDQTVIGNPAHDLIRLALSLATAARGSDLPGVSTARMMESLIDGYAEALTESRDEDDPKLREMPDAVRSTMRNALQRRWKHLARERIDGLKPKIPYGKKFWPLPRDERAAISALLQDERVRRLITSVGKREEDAPVNMVDAAYWVKGCSSLGLLRYAVLARIGDEDDDARNLCLIDIKEAVKASAPRYPKLRMPRGNAERVVVGAQHLAPHLGERMLDTQLLEHPVFLRELFPQDLKLELDALTHDEASVLARFLAGVVGRAHARQLGPDDRLAWQRELLRDRSKKLDAPSWLWTSTVALVASHEAGYLEHCRRYALETEAAKGRG